MLHLGLFGPHPCLPHTAEAKEQAGVSLSMPEADLTTWLGCARRSKNRLLCYASTLGQRTSIVTKALKTTTEWQRACSLVWSTRPFVTAKHRDNGNGVWEYVERLRLAHIALARRSRSINRRASCPTAGPRGLPTASTYAPLVLLLRRLSLQ